MRSWLIVGTASLFLLALAGCGGSSEKAETPAKQIELPKSGPSPAGAGKAPSAQ